jgi:hypothetical protein
LIHGAQIAYMELLDIHTLAYGAFYVPGLLRGAGRRYFKVDLALKTDKFPRGRADFTAGPL